jgi:pimeloyl-ACP methyl ester carboxylesterase
MIDQTGVIESAPAIPLAEALERWQVEARVGTFDTDRYRCRYFVWGRGQPLVFIHGLADRARCFVPVIAPLTDSFRCIAYEMPNGDGDGAKLGGIRHVDLVADLFALLDHLKCGQACLYGASFGGTIALAALHTSPKRFLRAAIQSSFAHRKLAPMERAMASLARYWPGRMGELPLARMMQRRADAPAFASSAPGVWAFQRANSATTPVRAFAHRALLIANLDLRPQLAAITHPIMLLEGESDSIVGRSCTDELANGLPHADRLEFADCGHYAQYTHAAAVAETLRRFLLPPCGLTSNDSPGSGCQSQQAVDSACRDHPHAK